MKNLPRPVVSPTLRDVMMMYSQDGYIKNLPVRPGRIFFWTRFENLVAKTTKSNERVVPNLVAKRNWNDAMRLLRSAVLSECLLIICAVLKLACTILYDLPK